MTGPNLLGTTTENSIAIPLTQLGAPGVPGEVIIKAMFLDRNNDDPIRLNDQNLRSFEIKGKLSQTPPNSSDLNGAFDRTHGNSFIIAPDGVAYFEVETPACKIRLDINDRREVSMASANLTAHNANEARLIFLSALSQYLDRMSYLANIPTHIALVVARDAQHEVQYLSYLGPPRPSIIGPGGEELSVEMKPIYALYREAMNSPSPYYRVLCFHKIMEGLLGVLKYSLRKRARSAACELPRIKDVVPDHADFPAGLREHVGTPLKDFYDNFLSKQYRDAMAHFTLKRGLTLEVSSPIYIRRFSDVAFVADISTRALIEAHERNLRLILAAERRPL